MNTKPLRLRAYDREPSILPDLVALVGYGLLLFAVVGTAMRWLI